MYFCVKCTAGQALWHGGFYHSRGCICCRAAEFLSCLMLLPWDELQQKQLIVRGHKMQCKGLQAQLSVGTNRDHSIVCEKNYDSSTHKRIPPVQQNKLCNFSNIAADGWHCNREATLAHTGVACVKMWMVTLDRTSFSDVLKLLPEMTHGSQVCRQCALGLNNITWMNSK